MAASTMRVVCLVSLLALVTVSYADNDHGSDAISYDTNTFESAVANKKHFVMFFAPWCGHCKRLAPTWDELAKLYNSEESIVTIAKVDCTTETALCSDHEVTGYPTLKFFHQKADDFQRYKGNRDLESLKKFVQEQANRDESEGVVPPSLEQGKETAVMELTDETFADFIQEGVHFVKFYAPWCGHCKKLAPTWEELAAAFDDNEQISVSKVDCTASPEVCKKQGIQAYPSLIAFHNGAKVEQHMGSRTLQELQSFINTLAYELVGSHQEVIPKEMREEPVVDLTDDDFEDVISDGLTFVKFFAPWCGHCKRLAPTWEELGTANMDKPVRIAKVDCTKHKASCSKQSVRGYPTLVMFQNGIRLDDYKGERSLESLQKYVDGFSSHTEL